MPCSCSRLIEASGDSHLSFSVWENEASAVSNRLCVFCTCRDHEKK